MTEIDFQPLENEDHGTVSDSIDGTVSLSIPEIDYTPPPTLLD
jgi:hypothetical protein